jgi:hypothetical protein
MQRESADVFLGELVQLRVELVGRLPLSTWTKYEVVFPVAFCSNGGTPWSLIISRNAGFIQFGITSCRVRAIPPPALSGAWVSM